jgi:Chain length determinant protein
MASLSGTRRTMDSAASQTEKARAAGVLMPPGNGFRTTRTLGPVSPHATVELLRYWNLLWARRWLIASVTIVVALAFGVYARFYETKLYRAEALVTPIAPGDDSGELGLNSLGSYGSSGGLTALLGFGGAGDNVVSAERYLAIMQSYDFGVTLARQHNLGEQLAGAHAAKMTPWQLHTLLNSRFSFEYDYRSGNLSLYFIDPSPERARNILGLYMQSLRDKLRNEAVQTAGAAALSLQDEIRRTPDALLQNQLYELMAHQIQREKLAQVQANFAFKVIEPPVVPDHYYAPSARRAATLSGLLVLAALCGFIILREWLAAAHAHLAAANLPDSPSVSVPPAYVLERTLEVGAQGDVNDAERVRQRPLG